MPVAMLSSSLITEPKRYGRFNALDTPDPFPSKPGMVLIKPTSISATGGTATLGTNGQVTFSGITDVSLNGVFTSDFDNYVLAWEGIASGNLFLYYRLRSAGSDASGNNYTRQYLAVGSTSFSSSRVSSTNNGWAGYVSDSMRNAANLNIYGPYLAQPTAVRTVTADGTSGAGMYESADIHSLSTSYDGITLITASSSITGKLAVYGIRS